MADVIQLLPDAIANQIAAGEVIQRPASVVKELLENAVDAGGTQVKLIVKDAGKTLIQVIDNGCGMSETDARMCFERHATSKIRTSADLFSIRTMGFRGEAMASVAAVAQVELKSRRRTDELGTRILIEATAVKSQQPCQCSEGTSISVKNLFYNVPARRNFLKTNAVEMRHIIDEFQRVALANPDVFFSLHHNRVELFHLPKGNLRQRVVGIFGANSNKKLVPLNEDTDIVKLTGFIGKPNFARKTRGEQFFFVNNRFVKSGYLNHAIMGAYEELLQKDTYPFYTIFIEIDPRSIDINVHPTKQEIKFEDERLVYNYLKVAVRHALGQYNISPSIDFEQEINFSNYNIQRTAKKPATSSPTEKSKDSNWNLFPAESKERTTSNQKNWEKLYEGLEDFELKEEDNNEEETEAITIESQWTEQAPLDTVDSSFSQQQKKPYQIHGSYIVSQIKSGFLLIDQQTAHERILFERYLTALDKNEPLTQKELFPKTIELSTADAEILRTILPQVNSLGFDIQFFGQNAFVIHGVPAYAKHQDDQRMVELLIEQFRNNIALHLDLIENIAQSLAHSTAIKRGEVLTPIEMQHLIDELFACEIPYKGPNGKNCFITYDLNDVEKLFG